MIVPSREEFLALATTNSLRVVYGEILADIHTPVSIYHKISQGTQYSFLLESVTGGEQLGRYSIIGVEPDEILECKNGRYRISTNKITKETPWNDIPPGIDPVMLLEDRLTKFKIAKPEAINHFYGGAITAMAYDLVRYFENLPDGNPDELEYPDLVAMVAKTVVVFDHVKNLVRVVVLADPSEAGYKNAESIIKTLLYKIAGPLPNFESRHLPEPVMLANQSKAEFEKTVLKIKEYVVAGDGFQMVPSVRFTFEPVADALSIYRQLRSINPSPYMFLLRFGEFDLIGASPEILVTLHEGEARVRPIAGTRPRGSNLAHDQKLEKELLADPKERAEHTMLVDLGRNDLGRVCQAGTVQVKDVFSIERYSHVMHIVSEVRGKIRPNIRVSDVVRATFPAGTVSGAPKIRAMEIIDEVEPVRRGFYAGAAGLIGFDGSCDLCITLRTMMRKGERAYVQAGVGVVFDSVPETEYNEVLHKAQAAFSALKRANLEG
jgi:anthranilate synthase component 1